MAKLIVETEPFLLGERIQSEKEKIWYPIISFEIHVIWYMLHRGTRNELSRSIEVQIIYFNIRD